MNKLTVVSPAFYETTQPYQLLVDSCKHYGIQLHLYGLGEPWPWYFDAKVLRLKAEIEELDTELVLVCDADDAFIMGPQAEILNKYYRFESDIVVSADRTQEEGDSKFPQSIFRDLYPLSSTPWRYCNSGGYIGKKESILDLLNTMATLKQPEYIPIYRSKDWDNDQFRMSIAYLNGYAMRVDTRCNIFQTTGCAEKEELVWKSNYLMNSVTGNFPCIIHFNGNAPGIKETYEKCFALRTTQ